MVYTTPVESALMHKYRELSEEFREVGLLTGDVTMNPDATCLVMSVDVLRDKIYRDEPLIHDLAWVIFDDVHFIGDKGTLLGLRLRLRLH